MIRKAQNIHGFTLAEMLIVVVILGILAGLTMFGYRGWQQNLTQRELKSELLTVAAAMENAKNFSTTGYPTSLPESYKGGSRTTVTYRAGNGTAFCVEAQSQRYSSIVYYFDSLQKDARSGSCSSSPSYAISAPSPSIFDKSDSTLSVIWQPVSNATTYSIRYGTSSPTTVATCTSSPCTISGLAASTTYRVNVTAVGVYTNAVSGTINGVTDAAPAGGGGGCTSTNHRLVRSGLPTQHGGFYTLSYKRTADSSYTNYPGQYPTPGSGTYTFDQVINGLSPNTPYSYILWFRDQLGTPITQITGTFTPTGCDATSHQLVRSGLPTQHGGFYTLSYKRTADSSYTNYPGQYPTPGSGTYTFDQVINGLSPNTPYSYILWFRDQLGTPITQITGTFNT